jgi:hypothetical protein
MDVNITTSQCWLPTRQYHAAVLRAPAKDISSLRRGFSDALREALFL